MNLLLHILAALALAGVVRRTLVSERLGVPVTGTASAIAFAVAAIWVVHPLTTDAVTYIAQRTEILMGLSYLLTLYCAIRAVDAARAARRRWIVAAAIACAAGMASKQTMVTAPIVVWIWDWIFLPDTVRKSRRPLYVGLASTWLLLAALVAYERWPTSIGFALEGWTPWTYLLTQTSVIAHYVRLSFLGGPLSLDYDGWPMIRSIVTSLPYAVPLAVLLGLTVAGVLKRRAWAFPLAVWFAALAPSSSVLPLATEIAAERRMYVPVAAFVALAAVTVARAGGLLLSQLAASRRRMLAWLGGGAVLVAILVTYGSMTATRNRDFWSEERIWADTVAKRPANPRARLNYGVILAASRRTREAEQQLREAVRLKETSASSHANLGSVLCDLGKLEEGIRHLERALELNPAATEAYKNLGEAYGAVGNRQLAARNFAAALSHHPDEPFLLNRLGWLLATSPEDEVRDGARAVELAERAVQFTRREDAVSLDTLAAAYAETGRFEDAEAALQEALAVAARKGPADLLPELNGRLTRYRLRQPYRESAR